MISPVLPHYHFSSNVSQTNQAENAPQLPDDCLIRIFEILKKTDQKSFASVNHHWRQVACSLVKTLVLGAGEQRLNHCAERFPALRKVVCRSPSFEQLVSIRNSQFHPRTRIRVCPEWEFELRELQLINPIDYPSDRQCVEKNNRHPIAALLAILHFGGGLDFINKFRKHRGLLYMAIRTNFSDIRFLDLDLVLEYDLILFSLRRWIYSLRNSIENSATTNFILCLENIVFEINKLKAKPYDDKFNRMVKVNRFFHTINWYVRHLTN